MTTSPLTPDLPSVDTESFFDAILRGGERMTRRILNPQMQVHCMKQMLGLSVAGFAIYGTLFGILCQLLSVEMTRISTFLPPVVWIPVTLVVGFLVAIAVGLPSFYFYTQIAGLDASFRLITAQAVRVHARTSLFLLGMTPFYLTGALLDYTTSEELSMLTVSLGFMMPFVCGFFGLTSLYRSFDTLLELLPVTHVRRGNVVMRLVLCWAVFAAVVSPVAVWRLSVLLAAGH